MLWPRRRRSTVTDEKTLEQVELPPYVDSVSDDSLDLVCRDKTLIEDLKAEGLRLTKSWWTSRYRIDREGHEDTARIFARLRDAGVAFASDKGWGPEAIFQHYRDDLGLIDGPFICLFWRGPDDRWIGER